jgi:beta-glucosidase
MACVKHFALYGAPEGGRDYNSVDMSRNRMYNEYLAPYKAAVDAGVASVMSSFNDIDGVPATGNRWLLTDLLRKQWKFNGFVVSDYTSLSEMINHGSGNLQEVSAQALNAGLDMDMVAEGLLNTLSQSLKEKKVTQAQIDAACRNILVAKYKLGLFDQPYKTMDAARAKATILSAENRAFAREVATQSFVLLKNNQQALPLAAKGSIALIGPLANDKSNMLGTWAVSGDPQLSIPVLEGMKQVAGTGVTIQYAKGANITDDPALAARANVFGMRAEIDARTPEVMLEEALQLARSSDKVVVVVGEASEMSGEAASRADITLPPSQQKLLKALYATGKPVIVVNMSGRPLVLTGLTEGAVAILQVWHAGIEAGNAIADVLFGKVNPSGKLTMSFPVAVGQIPVYYSQKNTGRPQSPENKFSSKYLDIPNEPLFPFGYGLTYSTIEYGKPVLSGATLTNKGSITVKVRVTNAGKYDAREVVQCYVQDKVRSITPPGKELKAFQKVALKAGESKEVVFTITESMLAFWNADMKYGSEPGEFAVMVGGNSRDVQATEFTLKK